MKKASLLLLLFIFAKNISAQNYQTNGQEFWFGYMENLDLLFNGDPDFYIYVYSEEDGTGTLSVPATGLSTPFTYEANTMKKVQLPNAILYAEGSEDIENFGLKVDVTSDAQVFAYHYRIFFSESTLVLPIEALGTEYRVAAALDFNMSSASPSSFLIIATEDETEVEITPTGLTLGLRPPNVPFNITLNAGQSYQVQSLNDLSGSLVKSTNNKKLALFGGAKKGNIGCETADSHIYDQLLPVKNAATTYALIPFANQGYSIIKIIATEDDTELFFNNEVTAFSVINAGEFQELELNDPKILNCNKPVHVVQFTLSHGCSGSGLGDPNMLTLAPIQMRTTKTGLYNFDRFQTDPYVGASRRFVTLFTETGNTDNLMINNQNLSPAFMEFPEFPNYQFAQIELDTGAMILECPEGVLAYAYGFGAYDAYTYHLAYESPNTTSTSQINPEKFLNIWPKPCSDFLNIENKSRNNIKSLTLYDLNGRQVYDEALILAKQMSKWDVSKLVAGIYLLQYQMNGVTFSEKVVKVD